MCRPKSIERLAEAFRHPHVALGIWMEPVGHEVGVVLAEQGKAVALEITTKILAELERGVLP